MLTSVAMGSIWFFHLPMWLLVKPEAQTPPTPSDGTLKAGPFAQVVAFGASPCLNALAAYLVLHRPVAQPNCLRCDPQAGGLDILLRTVLSPRSRRAVSIARWLQCLTGWLTKKSRLPVAETRENGSKMPCGESVILDGLSGSSLPQNMRVCQMPTEPNLTPDPTDYARFV